MGRILIDLDSTFWNFMELAVEKYDKKYNTNLKLEDIKQYDIEPYIKCTKKEFFELANKSMFNKLTPYPMAVEFITWLAEKGYDIYFVTACATKTCEWRHDKLKEYIPWYDRKMLIMCHDKYIIDCDVVIDDCIENLEKFSTDVDKVVYTQPWNKNDDRFERIDSWQDWYDRLVRKD